MQGPVFVDEFGDTFSIIYGFTADGCTPRELRDRLDVVRTEVLKIPTSARFDFSACRKSRSFSNSSPENGIEMTQIADQSIIVNDAIFGFIKVLLEAIAIVLGFSFLSLGLHAGLVVATSIPLVLAMTFVGMELAGIGLQRISLGALIIALGLLVDGAMITVETMVGKLEEKWEIRSAESYAYESTAFPMLTGRARSC